MKALAFGLGLDVARRRKLSRYAFLARQVDPCDTAQHIVLRRDRPFARRDTCTTGSQPHSRYALENPAIDVSESFTYIARGAIYLVTDKLRDIRIKFGFVVEGRERDELCRNSRRSSHTDLHAIAATPARWRGNDSSVDFHTGDELPEALITAVDVHQFDWRACVDGLVADAPSDDDEA